MRIVVDVNHPAHVHFFKNFIWKMQTRGHEVLVTASEKDLTHYLLKKYNFHANFLDSYGATLIKKIINVPIIDAKMYFSIKNFQPDFFLGFGSIRAAHVAKMMGKPCVNFDDDEYSYPYYHFCVDTVCGFSGFKIKGSKVIKVDGFKELAYLHPNIFKPNPGILKSFGISPDEKFCVVRFVSWSAFHDGGKKGFDAQFKVDLIKELCEYCPVYISSEAPLPEKIQKYRLPIPPENIHDLLYYSTLLVSDSQTMTTEAAVLGTPAVRSNSFVGINDMGNFVELEKKFNLIYNCESQETVMNAIKYIFNIPDVKKEWIIRRENLVKEKIDVTAFMVWFIENYPRSLIEMKERPEIQYKIF